MSQKRWTLLQNWKNLGLQKKLVLVFILTISLELLINLVLLFNINAMMERVDRIYVSNVTLNQLSEALDSVQDSLTEYLNTKSSDSLDGYYRSEQKYRHLLEEMNQDVYNDEMLIAEKNIRTLSEDYLSLVDATVTAKRGRDVELYKRNYELTQEKCSVVSSYIYSLNSERFARNTGQYQSLLKALRMLEIGNMTMLLLGAILDILLVSILTGKIIRPLKDLSQTAKEVAEGNFQVSAPASEAGDEIGILSRTFNQMIESIRNYILQIRENMEKENAMREREMMMEGHLKDAQLKYLQAQINPHFLFNTLNAGAQLAMMEGADRTNEFIENMADFFRYNLKKLDEDTTIQEELHLVDSYIYILNVRFSGEIHYRKSMEEGLGEVRVPSMILQPLVENAVNYGIRGLEREGRIFVSVYRDEAMGSICLSVKDNGHGISEERIREIMEGQITESSDRGDSNGIGLANVITRLKLYFNTEDVLTIHSDGEDAGTEVVIWIPDETEESD